MRAQPKTSVPSIKDGGEQRSSPAGEFSAPSDRRSVVSVSSVSFSARGGRGWGTAITLQGSPALCRMGSALKQLLRPRLAVSRSPQLSTLSWGETAATESIALTADRPKADHTLAQPLLLCLFRPLYRHGHCVP